jgi:hypothetical protein
MSILSIATMAAMTAGFVKTEPGGSMAQSAAARTDYELLSGTWQLTRGVVNGKPVPASVLRNTILITDHNTFRFPKASGSARIRPAVLRSILGQGQNRWIRLQRAGRTQAN